MAQEQLAHVLSPLEVGPLTLKNRIVSSAHLTHFARDHLPSDQHVYYFREKAKGGLGLIIMEASAVHPTSAQFPTVVFAFDERTIPWYRRIAEAVHDEGAPVLAQLWHCGQHATWNTTRHPVLAPSDVPCLYYRETPKVMEHEDIRTVVEAFRQSARNVREGGLDGVEINGAHSYLLAQFMSPATNRRGDEYGGSLENRLRFALEVIEATRDGLGDDRVLGIRLSADELIPTGYSLDEGVEIAKRLVAAGQLDYLNVSVGVYPTLFMVMPPMAIPPGYQVHAATRVRQALRKAGSSVPVSTVGRIKDVGMADQIVESGQADLVCMTRATIADPFLPKKAAAGHPEEIRPCIACNQGCVGNAGRERPITCTVNAAAGYEESRGDGTLAPAERRKKVAVIGGGPGGLEAARVAAVRGHEVVLFEKRPELGGQVNIHAKAPMRSEFKEATDYLARQVNKLGVDVRLDTEASEADVLSLDADAVIVATG
jgi:2,4-dienoyl-CoA reductase-like NADH-dependent reductase (Old Yellow Enzyme family)